jgi:uncharacterized membrane protein
MIIREDSPQRKLTPAVGSCYGNGLDRLRDYFLELLVMLIIVIVIGIPSSAGSFSYDIIDTFDMWDVFGYFYGILVSGPVGYGVAFAYLKAARGEKPEIGDILEVRHNYLDIVIAGMVSSIIIVIGFMLLVIPGIIFACKLAFVPYLVVEKRMEAIQAIKESWSMTDGHALTVFLIGLAGIPICIAGLLCLIVGIVPAFMWIYLALSSLYHAVSSGGDLPAREDAPQGPFI